MFSHIFIIILVLRTAHGTDESACVITNTSCPCSFKPSSGSCMRHQGNNTCLMGGCNHGYKCDCLGYEQCSMLPCSIYTTGESVVPSVDVPFACHLTPSAGTCFKFQQLLTTINAADNARAEAASSFKEASSDAIDTTVDLQSIQQVNTALQASFDALDAFGERVTEEERSDIEQEAEIVVNAMANVNAEAAAIHRETIIAFNATVTAGYYQRLAHRRENLALAKLNEREAALANAANATLCARCDELTLEIQHVRNERRSAVALTGSWTKKARDAKNRSADRRIAISEIRVTAEKARARFETRSQRILTRLRASTKRT